MNDPDDLRGAVRIVFREQRQPAEMKSRQRRNGRTWTKEVKRNARTGGTVPADGTLKLSLAIAHAGVIN